MKKTLTLVAGLAATAASASAQTLPATMGEVGAFDARIVRQAAGFLSSPATWNRSDNGNCPRSDTTYTVRCALRRAIVEAVGLPWNPNGTAPAAPKPAALVSCSMDVSDEHRGGSCGMLWDEAPVFLLSRAATVTSGRWRTAAQPAQVWSGTMADAEHGVNYESRHGVEMVSRSKSPDQLIDFNNDPGTTFADVRAYFRELEARVLTKGAADLDNATDSVEIEIYSGGAGVARTYNGWYPVSAFVVSGTALRFTIDTMRQVAPNALDREILERASKIIASDAVWNRADNRKCPATATQWSIYCAVEKAQLEVAGGFHHRRPAGELVREIVDERTKARNYNHRMMDYNNDPTTRLEDVRSLFAEAIARIK